MLEAIVSPRGPYSLRLSARGGGDATRAVRDGVFAATLLTAGGAELCAARQLLDGRVVLRARSDAGLERLRFVLALDDDHSEFLLRFRRDPLLGRALLHLRGLRPARLSTVAHALLRALCEQLIQTREARAIERRVVRAATSPLGVLRAPPTGADLARFSPAELRRLGLHARRGTALVRLCRTLDLERLHALTTEQAAQLIERERGLGPWSAGVVCLYGLGRPERGLVGDLGLIKLVAALRGRWADASETAELLEPYGEWAGLASVYLLAAYGRGLLPLPAAA
jgi:AraC family transcriptional regulator of adaptative response / DNA-3-methyladenine glycosylase II